MVVLGALALELKWSRCESFPCGAKLKILWYYASALSCVFMESIGKTVYLFVCRAFLKYWCWVRMVQQWGLLHQPKFHNTHAFTPTWMQDVCILVKCVIPFWSSEPSWCALLNPRVKPNTMEQEGSMWYKNQPGKNMVWTQNCVSHFCFSFSDMVFMHANKLFRIYYVYHFIF